MKHKSMTVDTHFKFRIICMSTHDRTNKRFYIHLILPDFVLISRTLFIDGIFKMYLFSRQRNIMGAKMGSIE